MREIAETEAIVELVERLDGLPLAIELAAGKLPWVSPAELTRDLDVRISLLGDGPRTAPARQRTLAAAIAWSYDLLAEHERRVLRRLSVFPGSFDASAAQAVAGDARVLPALTRLADASLLVAEPAPEGTRYRLLMTVRAFARERLSEAGEATAAAAAAPRPLPGARRRARREHGRARASRTWLPRGRREHENFQAALRWSLERGDAEPAFELAARLGDVLVPHGPHQGRPRAARTHDA